jgi:hypothetical protein
MKAVLRISIPSLLLFATIGCAPTVSERPVTIADTAPRDAPVGITTDTAMARTFAMLEPCRLKALATWPAARSRFVAGLPSNQSLFVTTRIRDPASRLEQVFLAVDRIPRDSVVGRIWSDIAVVSGFHRGQSLTLPQSAIVDWMISKPDGSEEGNWMGKFLDAYSAAGKPPAGICD